MGVVNIVVAVLLSVLLHAGGQVISSQNALSQSVTSFDASIFPKLTSGNFDNLVLTPISIFGALTMTLPGADNFTNQELMVTGQEAGRQMLSPHRYR